MSLVRLTNPPRTSTHHHRPATPTSAQTARPNLTAPDPRLQRRRRVYSKIATDIPSNLDEPNPPGYPGGVPR